MEKIIIAGRKDGFGARLSVFFNAWYIAEKLKCKFGFVWPIPNGPMRSFNEKNQNKNIMFDIFSEEQLFSKDFCQKYSYTNKLQPYECHRIDQNKIYFKDLLSLTQDIIYAPLCNLEDQFIDFNKEDFHKKINSFWNSLKFSDNLQKLISLLYGKINGIKNPVAIHIRGGEIVHFDSVRKAGNYAYKALPIELAIEKIQEELIIGNDVLLFQDDAQTCEDIKYFCNNKNFKAKVYTFQDFSFQSLNTNERTFLELILMLQANIIYSSGNSNFSRLASSIKNIKQISLYNYFNLKQQYKILYKNIEKIPNIHHLQTAFSYYHLYLLAKKINRKKKYIQFLTNARKFDPDNELYDILLIDSYLLNQDFKSAEDLLEKNYKLNYTNFKKWLLNKFYNTYTSGAVFPNFKRCANENLPNLCHAVALICQDERDYNAMDKYLSLSLNKNPLVKLFYERIIQKYFILEMNLKNLKDEIRKIEPMVGAPARVKKHLAYKLGQAMVENSKSILGYIRIPFALMKIYIRYNKDQKTYHMLTNVNPNLLLPKLKEYADYKEALKLKEHLPYKLGEALIKANRNWYGGGYIKLWFEIRKIRRECALKRR